MASANSKTFHFPFKAYDIQNEFMTKLYETLRDGKIGIFESPTGTGKSLSIICSTLTWLNDFEEEQLKELTMHIKSSSDSTKQQSVGMDWFNSYSKQQEENKKLLDAKAKYEQYKKRQERIKNIKEKHTLLHQSAQHENSLQFDELFSDVKEIREAVASAINEKNEDDQWILSDYHSDEESEINDNDDEGSESGNDDLVTRIYYCSRTHSQLSQFVREIQKTQFADNVRVTALASRQTTCINESVTKLKTLTFINDQCLNLQKNKKGKATIIDDNNKITKKKKTSQGCPFYKSNLINAVQRKILTEIMDIEQQVTIGKKIRGCPYYASRRATVDSQLIVLPYNTLLHKNTREASGVKLKNSVIIIDEAHNLSEAITNIHNVEITGTQLLKAQSQLSQYQQRYRTRLNAKNMLYINQILFVLEALIQQLNVKKHTLRKGDTNPISTKLFLPLNFLNEANLDNMNLFKTIAFLESSDISKKLRGFADAHQVTIHARDEGNTVPKSSVSQFLRKINKNKGEIVNNNMIDSNQVNRENSVPSSPLNQIKEFLRALTSENTDGRIVVKINENIQKSVLKFLLLNPSLHLKEIVSEAKAIIVAGGTMQPFSEFSDQLFMPAGAKLENIVHFSCGHVIPKENLAAIVMKKGPSGKELNFTYQNRQSQPEMVKELGQLICNIINIVPGGIVCFFPSYEFANIVYHEWNKSKLLERLAQKKKIFKEPQISSLCDQVLAEYTRTIQTRSTESQSTGAILFSVVGGKMSEGINFSDDLGRCVIMIGMPYPNSTSPELKEKMGYLNSLAKLESKIIHGQTPGQQYYENLCLKAVNQSIGRAIRHSNDYAIILFVDSRYSRPQVQNNFPTWISSQIQNADSFGSAFASIRKFFNSKKKNL